jgi:hypothetical protein
MHTHLLGIALRAALPAVVLKSPTSSFFFAPVRLRAPFVTPATAHSYADRGGILILIGALHRGRLQ